MDRPSRRRRQARRNVETVDQNNKSKKDCLLQVKYWATAGRPQQATVVTTSATTEANGWYQLHHELSNNHQQRCKL